MSILTHARRPRAALLGPAIAATLIAASVAGAQQDRYAQHNLVSSVPGLASYTDPLLLNPWGISFGATSPFWISNAGSGTTTLYNGSGVRQSLVVSIPGPGGPVPGVPTGQVFNNTGAFDLGVGGAARFLFASATGTISGWNPAAGTTALTMVNQFPGSAYTGLAIAGSGATARLYAANFAAGRVDVFDGAFAQLATGGFVDPTLPAGYAPFNVQNLGGQIYVTYALFDPVTGEEQEGPGLGFVSVFDTDGSFVRRVASAGALDAPWGLALAPPSFGAFGNSLLVGNLGDGTINAFDPLTGALRGTLLDLAGQPLVNEGLWGIAFGNGGPGFDPNALYIAAGIEDEEQGLFAKITAVPEPTTIELAALGLVALAIRARRRRLGRSVGR